MQWLIICTPSRSLPCLDCGTNARHSTLPWMRSHILLHLYKRREHPTKSAIAIRMFLEILYPPVWQMSEPCRMQYTAAGVCYPCCLLDGLLTVCVAKGCKWRCTVAGPSLNKRRISVLALAQLYCARGRYLGRCSTVP